MSPKIDLHAEKYLKKLVGRKEVEDALQRLDVLTQEEARMAAVEALSVTRNIDDRVKGVDERVEGVDEKVQRVDMKVRTVDSEGNELRKDLRNWITPPDPSVNYNAASGVHQKGTAAWCIEGDTLANWKTFGTLLWIHGKPGSGKSILSSVIVRDIKSMCNAGSAFLAYFYFDFKDTTKQDSRALLSSGPTLRSFRCILRRSFSAHKRGSEQPTEDSLAQCLKDMLTMTGKVPVYLVVDALDESPNDSGIPSSREKVLKLVKEIVDLHHPNLPTQEVSLHEESGQKQDINDYITFVVHSDRRMKRWRDDDKDAVIENLTKKADGMFRWVFCQLEVLRHCFPTNLRRILEELPKSLDETYKRILKEINNANREHVLEGLFGALDAQGIVFE
ncbi:hypothetical protein EDB89DRAFT_2071643 [Lactarius sanguifluus]|nr:hypothetical protein EDB89DRAFT_2071643 [Lactarius sanguifluus]